MSLPAFLYHPDGFQTDGFRMMGRRVAGRDFMRALAEHLRNQPEQVGVLAAESQAAQQMANQLASYGTPATLRWLPMLRPELLGEYGCLHVPDPGIGRWAYYRASLGSRAYSLTGVIHTICSTGSMDMLARLVLDPLHSWDALICTSRAGRDVVCRMIELQQDYLAGRCGAQRFERPQLPLIPLGVHSRDYDFTPGDRQQARATLALDPNECVVLFVGRLSLHGKANPLPMYQAIARAAEQGHRITLVECGEYATPETGEALQELRSRFPQVRFRVVGGDRPASEAEKHQALAAADLFCSLSDNLQETFGLSVVEAMASGLPCLVSDWNGYRDTVRDGVDGFRIPCRSLAPGSAPDWALAHDLGLASYDLFIGLLSQTVVVDPEALYQKLTLLISNAELRQRLGTAARERARQVFDWQVIFAQYRQLWLELEERRRSEPVLPFREPPTAHPYRPDPSWLFAGFPSHHLNDGDRWCPGATALQMVETPALNGLRLSLFTDHEYQAWATLLGRSFRLTVPELAVELNSLPQRLQRQVLMLAKYGILQRAEAA